VASEAHGGDEELLVGLRRAHLNLQAAMTAAWDRDLPFDELLFDRWERARRLGFGDKASIYHLSYVYGDVTVGEHTWIGPFTLLDGSGRLTIGSWCSISAGVHIYTHDTVMWALSGGQAESDKSPVVIEDRCHIGASAVVSKGVRIGACSVVGAHSFVNRDVEPYSIVVGVPARRIGTVRIQGTSINFEYGDTPKP
jgi:acetyltransferase-like isoleucine patch superfamily enzyme